MMERDKLYIGGSWLPPADGGYFEIVSPETEEVCGRGPQASAADVEKAAASARESVDGGDWSRYAPEDRAKILDRAAELLEEREAEIHEVLLRSIGCPVSFLGPLQTRGGPAQLRYYAEFARSYAFEELREDGGGASLIRREPVGVVAAIIPWNSPINEAMNKIAPALAAGCAVVLKPSPEEPLTSLIIADVFDAAGLPAGALSVIPGGREVGEQLVQHPAVDKVAFTGSSASGKRIMALCADRMARVSLELGGKSAGIVLDDIDLSTQVFPLVLSSVLMSGQICAAQTRILVPASRYDETAQAICAAAAALPVGSPTSPTTLIGPLVASRQRDRVEGYISVGKQEGATLAVGGGRPTAQTTGWYVEPTVFTDVDNNMRIAREEIFGPVISVIKYSDEDDAVRIANDSPYGLAGGVWTSDTQRGLAVSRRVRAGLMLVNTSPPATGTPFGGFKESGIGREMGPEGFAGYVETKAIAIPQGGA